MAQLFPLRAGAARGFQFLGGDWQMEFPKGEPLGLFNAKSTKEGAKDAKRGVGE